MMEPINGPRAEVSAALPVIAFPAGTALATGAGVAAIAARAKAGDAVATSIIALLGGSAGNERFADLLGPAPAITTAAALYDLARRLDAEGRIDDALLTLAMLSETDRMAGLLGLAVLATRQRRFELARPLVAACLEAGERHPRASSLAGIGELELGDRQAAQAYLATAARLARRNPDYRGELQIAQRALLLMHLG